MGKHPSQPFNPDIARVFFRVGMIEAWGRGIERMLEACKNAGVPEPELRYEDSGLWVKFHYPDSWASGPTQERVLILLKANPSITRRQLAESVGLSENGVNYHLNRLKSGGFIRHVGSTKAGH
jgi:ATP-dependent DNA helicase RecG